MALQPIHELHRRRFGRNLGLGLALAALVAVIFALTLVKVGQGDRGHGPAVVPAATGAAP